MSANATGSGQDTQSTVNHQTLPSGESASACNTSSAGGGYLGPAKHTAGPHGSDWKNILDPRWDANNKNAEVRAQASAQARAEAEREKASELERERAKQRGDVEASRRAEHERMGAQMREKAASARAEGRQEVEQQAQRDAERYEREKGDAVNRAREDARREEDERRKREEEERVAKSGGVKDALKNIGRNVHGVGENVRGRVNAKVDRKFGHEDAAARHDEVADRGGRKIANGETEVV